MDLLGGLVLSDGRRWGKAAEPWQRADAEAILGEDGPRLHFLTRPRGASKTTDLAGVALAALVVQLPAGARGYAVAADADQASLLVDAARGFVARTPDLPALVEVQAARLLSRPNGASLTVLAADAPSAYSILPHLLIVDELANWPNSARHRGTWVAVASAMAKVPGSRLVILTTAGDPAHWSHRVLAEARSSPTWRVHEVPGPVPWLDPAALEEQRRLLTPALFARLHLNRWTAAEDRLASLDDLGACVTLDGPLAPRCEHRYVIGLDLGLRRDRTVAAVCHAESMWRSVPERSEVTATRIVLDRMQTWSGTRAEAVLLADVEEWLAQSSAAYNGAEVVYDPWQAVGMAQRLTGRGVGTVEFTFSASSVGRLAATLYTLISNHTLALPDDPELADELANLRLRETSPGVMRLDHDPDRHDDRAVALALAAHRLLESPGPTWTVLPSHRDRGWTSADGMYHAPASHLLDPSRVGF